MTRCIGEDSSRLIHGRRDCHTTPGIAVGHAIQDSVDAAEEQLAFTLFDEFFFALKVPLEHARVPEQSGVQRVLCKRVVIDVHAVEQVGV